VFCARGFWRFGPKGERKMSLNIFCYHKKSETRGARKANNRANTHGKNRENKQNFRRQKKKETRKLHFSPFCVNLILSSSWAKQITHGCVSISLIPIRALFFFADIPFYCPDLRNSLDNRKESARPTFGADCQVFWQFGK